MSLENDNKALKASIWLIQILLIYFSLCTGHLLFWFVCINIHISTIRTLRKKHISNKNFNKEHTIYFLIL